MPVVISNGFIVHDIDPANPTNDEMNDAVALRDGRIAVVANGIGSSSDILLDFISVNGGPDTAPIVVNTTTFGKQTGPQIIQLANGNIVVSWTDSSETAPDFFNNTVRFQVFSADGQRIGTEQVAPTTFSGDQENPNMMKLADGRFVISWEGEGETLFQIFNPDGTKDGGEKVLPVNFGSPTEASMAPWGQGLVAVGAVGVWTNTLMIRFYNGNGNDASRDPIVVASGGSYSNEKIVQLANGTFAVIWTDNSNTPPFNKGPIIRAQVISHTGDLIGSQFTVSDDIFSEHSAGSVTALADGRFVITWKMNPDGDFLAVDIVARVFNADGTPATDIFTIHDKDIAYDGLRQFTNAYVQSVEEFPDGRIAFTLWTLSSTGDNFVTAIRIVDTRDALNMTLDANDNTYTGTSFNDRIDGLDGADSLYGAGGSDTLLGSGGNDHLYGGEGTDTLNGGVGDDFLFGGDSTTDLRDVLYGGEGNDSMDGGYGNDELSGGNGRDTLIGNFGTDTLVGNGGDDVILGGAGADLIFGNDGNDQINGGFGFDRMSGGAGADQFIHQGVIGHGSDWIQDYSADQDDLLVCGLAGATRAQFQVNFSTTAGAGADGVQEAFIVYRPTGQILWALIDGAGQDHINVQIGGQVYDLLA